MEKTILQRSKGRGRLIRRFAVRFRKIINIIRLHVARAWKMFMALSMQQKRLLATILLALTSLLILGVALLAASSIRARRAAAGQIEAQEDAQGPLERAMPVAAEPDEPEAVLAAAVFETLPALVEPTEPEDSGVEAEDPEEPEEPEEAASLYVPLKKHDESPDVMALQQRLIALGYLEIDEPTEYFGSATEYAVKLFQRQHGLEQDGAAGERTQALLFGNEAQKYTLKEGVEGRDVKMLQEQLADLGYLDSKQVDSVYGEVTQEAVKAFQKRNKLTADGMAGEKTLEKLYSDDAKVSATLAAKIKAEEEAAKKKAKEEAKKAKDEKKKAEIEAAKKKKVDKLISAATAKIGSEYVLGDRGPDTFDCSGFVWYCLKQAGVSTKRLNAAGFSKKSDWKEIKEYKDVQRGDLLFFRSDESSKISHTGIYIGSGMMIDASSGNGKVVKRAVSAYWKRNFVNARRPLT